LQTATTATRYSLQGAYLVGMSGLTIQQRFDAFVQLISYLISADAVVMYGPTILQRPLYLRTPEVLRIVADRLEAIETGHDNVIL
jgi:hypothetical protein